MGFNRGRPFHPGPVRNVGAVFAIGRQVFVACSDDHGAGATLTDEAGTKPLQSLRDGTRVAVLAWRPGPSGTTRYRVRVVESGADGWLPVANLRATEIAVEPAPTAVPAPAVVVPGPRPAADRQDTGRRFGQRSG